MKVASILIGIFNSFQNTDTFTRKVQRGSGKSQNAMGGEGVPSF